MKHLPHFLQNALNNPEAAASAPASAPAPVYIASLECLNSKGDRFGNRYFAFIYTDHNTGRAVRATISGGKSNVESLMYALNGGSWEPRNVLWSERELAIRQYNREVKGWPYAGCTGEDLARFVRAELAKPATS